MTSVSSLITSAEFSNGPGPRPGNSGKEEDEDMRAMARYIVANPLRASLVEHIGDYPLWDAVWLDEALSG